MTIKTGVLSVALIISAGLNTSNAQDSQEAALGKAFAKCAADVSVFHKSMPSLTFSDSDPNREKAILWLANTYTLASNFLLGKEDSEQLIRTRMASSDSEAKAALDAGKQNDYISSFLENTKGCSSLFDNQTALKSKINAYAAEH